jgi:hypothetical protein
MVIYELVCSEGKRNRSYSHVQIFIVEVNILPVSVNVIERSIYDMSFKYFLNMPPEEPVIEPSSLPKFRKLRLKGVILLEAYQYNSEIAIEKEIIKNKAIIVDTPIQKLSTIINNLEKF